MNPSLPSNPDAAALTDVRRTLAFSGNKLSLKYLWLGLLLLAGGVLVVILNPPAMESRGGLMLVLTFVLGFVIVLYAALRLILPGPPPLMLSPGGLHLHIEWVKDIRIPWREVRGVETIDITGYIRGHEITFTGVTVILVSRAFYDRFIHVKSSFLRGPGWDTNFIPKGDMVQIALHHEALPATAEELRTAVECRWQAFRNASPVSVPQVSQARPAQ